jgi:hypothetical protein
MTQAAAGQGWQGVPGFMDIAMLPTPELGGVLSNQLESFVADPL